MLGNFSIGDYFRKEVIAWAFEILTDPIHGFGMDKDKLYMTYNPTDKESWELMAESKASIPRSFDPA
jgi:alanyl-tRNA synthetase